MKIALPPVPRTLCSFAAYKMGLPLFRYHPGGCRTPPNSHSDTTHSGCEASSHSFSKPFMSCILTDSRVCWPLCVTDSVVPTMLWSGATSGRVVCGWISGWKRDPLFSKNCSIAVTEEEREIEWSPGKLYMPPCAAFGRVLRWGAATPYWNHKPTRMVLIKKMLLKYIISQKIDRNIVQSMQVMQTALFGFSVRERWGRF